MLHLKGDITDDERQELQLQLTRKLVSLSIEQQNILWYRPPTEEQAQANWDAMYPPILRQRIWAKFLLLAQWIRPGRN